MGGIINGFFGDSGSDAQDALEEQTRQTRAETQRKIDELRQQRFDIIRSQGGQNWNPEGPNLMPKEPINPGKVAKSLLHKG